jgi:hypothetical protein
MAAGDAVDNCSVPVVLLRCVLHAGREVVAALLVTVNGEP